MDIDRINKKKFDKNKWKTIYPWLRSYHAAKSRCKKNPAYVRKGIKFLMTQEDFKFLWFRDKGYSLSRPSIDRIDCNGNYVLNNCRFIELIQNIKESCRNPRFIVAKTHCPQGHEFIEENFYRGSKGEKICRICNRMYCRRYKLRKKKEKSTSKGI